MSFDGSVEEFVERFKAKLPKVGKDLLVYFGAEVQGNILDGTRIVPPQHRAGIGGQLQMSSGRLGRSYDVAVKSADKDREYSVDVKEGAITLALQSKVPYATIQNRGGAITITPKARRFFWAMYYQEGKKDDFWKALALKKTPIVIKATDFFNKSVQGFKQNAEEVATNLLTIAWNNSFSQ